ncbi:MAG: orotidine 5'-phosphate decarboxylase / HUMPS family protein [Planctomycetota bacterium]|jgi:3-hexulose-6-phosphate synthase/6-phospho-3-hexuloisomerase
MGSKLQVALDFINLNRALKVAEEAVKGGADILEAGTPLIKSEGLDAVRALKGRFPDVPIVADMKIMDTGRLEVEIAAKAGASYAVVMGAASDATIRECIEAGKNYGVGVGVDTLGVEDGASFAKKVQDWGADFIAVHIPIDDQMAGEDPLDKVRAVRKAAPDITLAAAGGIHSESAGRAATADIRKAVDTGEAVATTLFKRVDAEGLRETFLNVSTPNISDAMHREPCLPGITPIALGTRMAGPACCVRSLAGDWAKPVEAIEHAMEGEVLVIEAGGIGPALWGELATESAVNRKLGGIVIDGAIRDVPDIRRLKFPAFAKLICSEAGEPKGFGEIGVPVKLAGRRVEPGDWVVGDDNGVMVVPKAKAVEVANRAMGVLELENRLREEIRAASTLSEVMELLRWEKK